jgi:predicted DNA-binding transcriptional regulator AlpA
MTEAPKFLTPSQLAKRWENIVSRGTIDQWRAKRRGPKFIRLGSRIVYAISDVEDYEKQRLSTHDTSK